MKIKQTLVSLVITGASLLALGCEGGGSVKPAVNTNTQPNITSGGNALTEKERERSYKNCKIAFISNTRKEDDGVADKKDKLWIMNADGSEKQRLTESYTESAYPDWSPDGKKILFVSIGYEERGIYCANLDDGGRLDELVNPGGKNLCPQWSPDGKQFAFVSNLEGNVSEICISNLEMSRTNRFYQITKGANSEGYMRWSPDGKKIAFIAHEGENLEIKVMNVDGSGLRSLTNHSGYETTFCWSPDSKRIAFTSFPRIDSPIKEESEIYSINVNGSEKQRLTHDPGTDVDPVYSPDGKKIAFVSYRDREKYGYGPEIFVMNTDGSEQRNLTKKWCHDDDPQWSPDGKKIAFVSDRTMDKESRLIPVKRTYIMDADGNNVNLLTPTIHYEHSFQPRWSPFLK